MSAMLPGNRIPPQDLDMERAVLGAVIIDHTKIETVQGILQPEDFYREAHRVIYEAMLTLWGRSEPIDLTTLEGQLRRQGSLDLIGGPGYLLDLTGAVASTENATYYARRVEARALQRRLINAAQRIQAEAYDDVTDVAELLDRAEQYVFSVGQRRSDRFFDPLGKVAHDVMDDLDRRILEPNPITGLPTNFRRLDLMTAGLQRSDFIIIAARPSMGKTALALTIARNVAQSTNLPVAVFSLEMSSEQLCMRMIASEANVDALRLRSGRLRTDELAEVGQACGRLAELPIFIDDSADITALDIRSKCRRLMAEQKGLGLVVVDYLQLLRGHKRTENRNQEITEMARALKALARELKVPVITLSQLSRAVEHRQDKRPMLSDLRESGSIEAEADVVIFIYRDSYYREKQEMGEGAEEDSALEPEPFEAEGSEGGTEVAELIIAKQRNGPTGTVKVTFHPRYVRFANLAEQER